MNPAVIYICASHWFLHLFRWPLCFISGYVICSSPSVSDVCPHPAAESKSGAEEPLLSPQPLEDGQQEEDSAVVEYCDPYAEEDPPWAPRSYDEKGALRSSLYARENVWQSTLYGWCIVGRGWCGGNVLYCT